MFLGEVEWRSIENYQIVYEKTMLINVGWYPKVYFLPTKDLDKKINSIFKVWEFLRRNATNIGYVSSEHESEEEKEEGEVQTTDDQEFNEELNEEQIVKQKFKKLKRNKNK